MEQRNMKPHHKDTIRNIQKVRNNIGQRTQFLSNKLQGKKNIEIEREAIYLKILQEIYNPTGMYGPYTAPALNIQFVKKFFSLLNRKILTLSIWWHKEISVTFSSCDNGILFFALLFNSHLLGKHTKEKTNDLGIENKANKQKRNV